MMYRKSKLLILIFITYMGIPSVFASTISLIPSSAEVIIPTQIIMDLQMDFSDDPTVGGGLDIFYNDSLVDFVSFVPNLALGDPDFSRIPDDDGLGMLEGLAFGDFGGLSGPASVGTLTFDTLMPGTAVFTMGETTDPLKGGGFISAVTFSGQDPMFVGASVKISAVPVPAAVWLFGSGLLGLVSVARRRMRI